MRRLRGLLDGLDDPGDIISRLFAATTDPWFEEYAQATAMKMVTHLFTDSGRTWRQAAKSYSKGKIIYKALMEEMQGSLGAAINEAVQRNAHYIKSVPADIARQMTEHTMAKSMAGLRPEQIAQDLKDLYPHISDVKANLIARTETAKTATALTQSRCEGLGIQWYEWRTSEDQRVRTSHRHMDHVLVAWDNPPSPEELVHEKDIGRYPPGGIWNCRCFASPLMELDEVSWPHDVYFGGKIQKMTRKQFERIWTPSIAV